jgi:hypothetical protein
MNGPKYRIFGESYKNFGIPIKKSKFENLATLLRLTPLVGFLAMAVKIRSTRGKFFLKN